MSIKSFDRGWYGKTYKITTKDKKYFVKFVEYSVHKKKYKKSFDIINFMINNGIDFIPNIIATKNGKNYAVFKDMVCGVFDFVEASHTENYRLEDLIERLSHIYKLKIDNIMCDKFSFDTKIYNKFLSIVNRIKANFSIEAKAIIEILEKNEAIIQSCKTELFSYAKLCKNDFSNFCITSGDIGGNCIVNKNGINIID